MKSDPSTSKSKPRSVTHVPSSRVPGSSSQAALGTDLPETQSKVYYSDGGSYNYGEGFISRNVVDQAEQCFVNIAAALTEADASMADIVRVRYILVDKKEFKDIWPVCRKWLEGVRPACTMIEAGLAEDAMKVEIEVTALKAGGLKGAAGPVE